MKKLEQEFEEEVFQAADTEEAKIIDKGKKAEEFMAHPFWEVMEANIKEIIEELNTELLNDPDVENPWYNQILFSTNKHYIFCQVRRKLIKILIGFMQQPRLLINDARNALISIREKEQLYRFKGRGVK
jgi:ribosome biogenesis protein Nip4